MLDASVTTQLLLEQSLATNAPYCAIREEVSGRAVSYKELDSTLERGARVLAAEGFQPGDVLAVAMRRSWHSTLCVALSIRAGVPFVPIEPDHGAQRAARLLSAVRPKLVITDVADELNLELASGATSGLRTLHPEQLFGSRAQNIRPYRHAITANDLAYLLPTSGSTGSPKLVMVPHGALVNRIRWGQTTYPLGQDDTVLCSSSPVFDYALWEIAAPLCFGAQVLVGGPDVMAPEGLRSVFEGHDITCIHFVPSVLREHLPLLAERKPAGLRYLMCGGEALDSRLLAELQDALLSGDGSPKTKVFNQYGPAEACIDCTCWQVPESHSATIPVPIGTPIEGVQSYILDAQLNEVPDGEVGHLFVAGDCLAWGYYGSPGETARRFIPNPFAASKGSRLYDTGDRVRRTSDGQLEFVGRADDQVKIRGVRVEPLEVQLELSNHPQVVEAVVLARDGALLACVVMSEGAPEQDLRSFLAHRVPLAAVPQRIVRCAAIPRLVSGKVDRAALLSMQPEGQMSEDVALNGPPISLNEFSPVETKLRELWRSILGVEELPGTGDFFELGGHSLLATRLVARIRKTFKINLPLRQLWDTPTPSALAVIIDKALGQEVA